MRIVAQVNLYQIQYTTIARNSAFWKKLEHKNALNSTKIVLLMIIDLTFQSRFFCKLRSYLYGQMRLFVRILNISSEFILALLQCRNMTKTIYEQFSKKSLFSVYRFFPFSVFRTYLGQNKSFSKKFFYQYSQNFELYKP